MSETTFSVGTIFYQDAFQPGTKLGTLSTGTYIVTGTAALSSTSPSLVALNFDIPIESIVSVSGPGSVEGFYTHDPVAGAKPNFKFASDPSYGSVYIDFLTDYVSLSKGNYSYYWSNFPVVQPQPFNITIRVNALVQSAELFTGGVDTVNFAALTAEQVAAVGARPTELYKALGGNDAVTLPDGSTISTTTGNVAFDHNTPFSGGGGDDTIKGGAANDFFAGVGVATGAEESGNNQMSGGGGLADTVVYPGDFAAYELDYSAARIWSAKPDIRLVVRSPGVGSDTIANDIEFLQFGAGKDTYDVKALQQFAVVRMMVGAMDSLVGKAVEAAGAGGEYLPWLGAMRDLMLRGLKVGIASNPAKQMFVESVDLASDTLLATARTALAAAGASQEIKDYAKSISDRIEGLVRDSASKSWDVLQNANSPIRTATASEILSASWGTAKQELLKSFPALEKMRLSDPVPTPAPPDKVAPPDGQPPKVIFGALPGQVLDVAGLAPTPGTGQGAFIQAGDGPQTIKGSRGNDYIAGGEGDDVLVSGGGSDLLDGGAGVDAAAFGGVKRAFLVGDLAPAQAKVSALGGEGPGSTLVDVENIQFYDGFLTTNPNEAAGQVYRVYGATLGRAPDAGGLAYWHDQVQGGGASVRSIVDGFTGSAEFQAKYGATTNEAFVQLLYANVLGRQGEAAGVRSWTGSLDAGAGRADVVLGFSDSQEYVGKTAPEINKGLWVGSAKAAAVTRLYDTTLDRRPDAEGLNAWTKALEGGTPLKQMSDGFTGSAEFQAKYGPLDDRQFVELLYNNVLDRPSDPGGLAAWTGALAAGALQRSDVVLGFSESHEHVAKLAPVIDDGIWIA